MKSTLVTWRRGLPDTFAVFLIYIIPPFPQNEEHAGDLEARITRYLAITSADIEEFPPQVIFSNFLPVLCQFSGIRQQFLALVKANVISHTTIHALDILFCSAPYCEAI
jgi:hypothetical protein